MPLKIEICGTEHVKALIETKEIKMITNTTDFRLDLAPLFSVDSDFCGISNYSLTSNESHHLSLENGTLLISSNTTEKVVTNFTVMATSLGGQTASFVGRLLISRTLRFETALPKVLPIQVDSNPNGLYTYTSPNVVSDSDFTMQFNFTTKSVPGLVIGRV